MTQELFARFPMDAELLRDFRGKALTELKKTPELVYEYDVHRFENDDLFAHRYLGHQFFLKEDKKTLVERSVKMVLKSFKWRKAFGVQNIKKQDLPEEFFERKSCIRLKDDKLGRQVVVIKVSTLRKTKSGERPVGEKFLIYWLENIFQRNENGLTVIIDCGDATLNNVNMDLVDFARIILKKYYPAFLGYFLVFKFPKIFESVWDVIKKLLPQAGVDRVKFVDKTSILEYVDADKLPEYYGGTDQSELQFHETLKDTDVLFREKIEEEVAKGVKSLSLG